MLKGIPTDNELSRLYHELALHGAKCIGEKRAWPYRIKDTEHLFCLAADMSRYDPRLITVLVRFLMEQWRNMNPSAIRSIYPEMSTPQTVAVVAEFAIASESLDDEGLYYAEYLQRGLTPTAYQFYFHHLYTPGGNMMNRALDELVHEYRKWGFIAREMPVVDDVSRRAVGTHDVETRRNILAKLLKDIGNISLSDYLTRIGNSISRQQALLDIKSMPGIERVGNGRGARWRTAA